MGNLELGQNSQLARTRLTAPRLGIIIPTLSRGGAERIVSELGLGVQGWDPILFLFEDRLEYPWSGEVAVLGIDLFSSRGRLSKLASLVRGGARLFSLRRRTRCSVTLSLLPLPDLLNLITRGGDATIVSVHNTLSRSLGGRTAPVMKAMISWLYPKASLIVAVSHGVKDDLVRNFGLPAEQIRVISNPVSIRRVEEMMVLPLPETYSRLFDERDVFVSVGRLAYQKGYDVLIAAYARLLQETSSEAVLCLIGEGPEGQHLERLCEVKGLTVWSARRGDAAEALSSSKAQVVFTGVQANPFSFIQRSKSFVLSSRWEGFGIVLIEALACGVPVISSDCWSGPREILDPHSWRPNQVFEDVEIAGFGMLTASPELEAVAEARAEKSLCSAFRTLIENPELEKRLRRMGPSRAADFDLGSVSRLWEETFATLTVRRER